MREHARCALYGSLELRVSEASSVCLREEKGLFGLGGGAYLEQLSQVSGFPALCVFAPIHGEHDISTSAHPASREEIDSFFRFFIDSMNR
jgi:hypothetical protein